MTTSTITYFTSISLSFFYFFERGRVYQRCKRKFSECAKCKNHRIIWI